MPSTTMTNGVLLYADLIDHLVYSVQGAAIDHEQRDYRVAAQNAYREVAYNYNWQYYYTQARIDLQSAYDTGTVSSVGTTVSGDDTTFPSWAAYGRIQVGNVVYPVAKRIDVDELILEAAPITAWTAGTAYTLFQNIYSLPNDFRGMNKPMNEMGSCVDGYISPNGWLTNERQSNNAGNPQRWTIVADPDQVGAFALAIEPYPTEAATLDYLYQRSPRRLRLTGYETASRTGTVSATAAGTTVTGVGTTFAASMVGSFIRFSSSSSVPDGDGGLNPYTEQYEIITFTDTTHVEVYPAIATSVSGVGFVISDPVDMSRGMQSALLRRCELELGIARGKDMGIAQQLYRDALILARESDSMVHEPRVAGGVSTVMSIWKYPTAAI